MNIKLIVEFDGTNYCGWQRQQNACSVQQILESAIEKATGEKCETLGCSRTDAGVHAKGYCANFHTLSSIPPQNMKFAINTKLPSDIVVINSEEADDNFHARYNSKGKTYSYTLFYGDYEKAILRNYIYSYRHNLNVELMKEAAKYFIGAHDFTAFKSKGSSAKSSVRTVTQFDIVQSPDEKIIKFYISANGFLYNMARIMIGTVLEVGREKIEPSYIKKIIQEKNRKNAGKTAPAKGLCLEKVFY